MYILGSQLGNIAVLSLQTGQTVAKTVDQIIEPGGLELMAFRVVHKANQPAVILLRDIRRVTVNAIVVDSEDDITDPSEIVRLQDTINRKFKLKGLKVVNESGQRLGSVDDYTIGLGTHKVQKIYVKPPLLRSLLSSNLIIDRAQIIDISNSKITVRDANVPSPSLAGVKPLPTD